MSLRRILPRNLSLKVADVDVVQQIDYGLETIPSLAAILTINYALKYLMRQVLGITKFPHPLVGMFMAFAGLMSMKEKDAVKVRLLEINIFLVFHIPTLPLSLPISPPSCTRLLLHVC